MSVKQFFLDAIAKDPTSVRDAFRDDDVLKGLAEIGIGVPMGITVLELHVPSPKAKKTKGMGATLCGKKGTLGAPPTCKSCLKNLAAPVARRPKR